MLIAKLLSGEKLLSYDKKYYDIIKENKDNLICPHCNKKLIFVDGTFVIKHFRHHKLSDCSFEPETKEHIQMKKFFCKFFKLNPLINLEVNLGFAIPDIYIPKEKIAIEVQRSELSYKKFIERTENYTKNGIYVLWVFHEDLVKENVSNTLKKAHEIYYGRIYVFKEWTIVHKESQEKETKETIYPVHFVSKGRFLEGLYGSYFKYYKRKKDFLFGEIIKDKCLLRSNNTWEDNNYLIAKFKDNVFWRVKKDDQ